MNWLTTSARIIAKSVPGDRVLEAVELDRSPARKNKAATTRLRKEQMTAVVWTTPLGLPVVQPYRKIKRKQINASLQTVYISDPNAPAEGEQTPNYLLFDIVLMRFQFDVVNSQKQATAFPPNFIHSLDATHMLLTALECRVRFFFFSVWGHGMLTVGRHRHKA